MTNQDKKKVIVYGNCHTRMIKAMLRSSSQFNEQYEIIDIEMIQNIKDPSYLKSDIFKQCDVFLHQSIRLNNRYGEEYASENIISRLKTGCRVISIPNVYHLPLCFFPQFSEKHELKKNGTTHFFRDEIIDKISKGMFSRKKKIKEAYLSDTYFNHDEIKKAFLGFIDKVKRRESDWDIKVSDFINANYKEHQLFFDPNHPTNFYFGYVSNQLLRIILNEPERRDEVFLVEECLDAIEMPTCKSVQAALGLCWEKRTIRDHSRWARFSIHKMTLDIYISRYIAFSWLGGDSVGFEKYVSIVRWYIISRFYASARWLKNSITR